MLCSLHSEGYIQGRTEQGDRVLLYLGVIDILQSYKLKKRLEHSLKAIITDGVSDWVDGGCGLMLAVSH